MLHAWELSNFKSIGEAAGQLDLGKITILAGANSSGKSTVIQSLLLLAQTLNHPENEPLLLNGSLVALGEPAGVWHNGDMAEPLKISFLLDDPNGREQGYYEFQFAVSDSGRISIKCANYYWSMDGDTFERGLSIVTDGEYWEIVAPSPDLEVEFHEQIREYGLIPKSQLANAHVVLNKFLPYRVDAIGSRTTTTRDWEVFINAPTRQALSSTELDILIPRNYWQVIRDAIRKLELPPIPQRDGYSVTQPSVACVDYWDWFALLPLYKVQQLQDYYLEHLPGLTEDIDYPLRFRPLLRAERTISSFFRDQLRYLSANRIGPTALFGLEEPSQWAEVGINGGNLAAALERYQDQRLGYWDPEQRKIREGTLREATLLWLHYFGMADGIEPVEYGKLGTFLRVRTSGIKQDLDLTAVGFGTSQILPIIVQGLLTPPDGLFVVEQPEVHLHPKVQSDLAHFFFGLSQVGRQCIIETHSEHLVNQFRLLAARGDADLNETVKIYFAQRDSRHGTHFEPVYVDKHGSIRNWPAGFMDEGPRLAKEILAQTMNRQ